MSKATAMAKFAPSYTGANATGATPTASVSPGQAAAEAEAVAHTAGKLDTTIQAPSVGQQASTDPAQVTQQQQAATADERMAALLKKETSLVRDREAFNKEKAEALEDRRKAQELLGRGKQFEELLPKDPIAALRLIGYTDTQIFEIMSKQGQPPAEKTPADIARETAQAEIKADREAREAEAKKAEAERNTSVVSQFRGQINEAIKSSAEKFPMVSYGGELAAEQVFLNISEHTKANHKNPGFKMLTVEEAMKDLEDMYNYDFEQKLAIRNKKQQPPAPSEAPAQTTQTDNRQQQPASTQAKPRTLTNQVGVRSTTGSLGAESAAAKRARLERVLATGDTSLLKG